ncbi:type II toxin-antitoxin system YafQ family toxin [Helicobacter sp. MIT 05-5294]|uniref:type II toxin-antitoxin system YafQ family toxin n=1 Tax=Helicobacter sp. MIT 05-5294 TaxID=1548150 RepID=UPI00051FA559|nr:type II toxin-antitoxin system YafQ family toxin [Helicobacter sp. MIT 05-5294]TLD85572.1 type II toxin-antitoxin system YafQ family toxin [Helicobacter sp. MIT 05-5294]
MYELYLSKRFSKDAKKLNPQDLKHTMRVLQKLCNGEKLEHRYNDHALQGKFSKYRDCHIKPDLVLIYEKKENLLILKALRIGKHSEIFK